MRAQPAAGCQALSRLGSRHRIRQRRTGVQPADAGIQGPPGVQRQAELRETNAKAPCLPILPMHLAFTAPVSIDKAMRISLAAGKTIFRPEISADDRKSGYTQQLEFKGPFPKPRRSH